MIKTIELFGGIGTTNMAFSKIFGKNNVETIACVEWDEKSVTQFNAIHGTNFGPCDVQRVRGQDIDITHNGKDIFVLTNSSPCQSLSGAGKREGMAPGQNDLSSLIWESLRIIKEMFQRDPINKSHLPHYIITENVVGIHNKRNKDWFDTIIALFQKFGYECFWRDVNGKDIAEPQMRNRCFLVCVLRDCGLPTYIPYEKPAVDPIAARTANLHKIFASTTRQEIEEEGVILADFGKNPDALMQFPYLVSPKNKKITPVAKNPYFCIVETSYQSIQGKNFCKIYTDRVPTLLCNQVGTKVVDTYNKVYRYITSKEAWLLQDYSVSDYEKAKATGLSPNSLHKTAGDAILLNAFKQVIQQITTEADPTDCYADNKAQNGDLKESREEMYRLAYLTYNRIHKTNLETVLPKNKLAEFGRETDSKKKLKKSKAEENYIVQERMWAPVCSKAANTSVTPKQPVISATVAQLPNNFEVAKRQISKGINKQLILDTALLLAKENELFKDYFKSSTAYTATRITLAYAIRAWCSKNVSNYDLAKSWQKLEQKMCKKPLNKEGLDKLKICKVASLKLNHTVFEKYSSKEIEDFYQNAA